jgi:hypothetical protein
MDSRLPGQAAQQEARRNPHGQGQGQPGDLGPVIQPGASSSKWKASPRRWRTKP